MTTKTIKTILFASLIAVMVLPFSGMQSAEAVHNYNEVHAPTGQDTVHIPTVEPQVPDERPEETRANDGSGVSEVVPVPTRQDTVHTPTEEPQVPDEKPEETWVDDADPNGGNMPENAEESGNLPADSEQGDGAGNYEPEPTPTDEDI